MQRQYLNYLYLTVFLILCGIYPQQAVAEGEITLEHTEHWAAISDESGFHSVSDICSGDINDGAGPAIISLSTRLVDGMAHAELRIARWDGSVFEVLDEQSWSVASQDTYGRGAGCTDLGGEGALDIVTGVTVRGNETEIRVWRWDSSSESLSVEGEPLLVGGQMKMLDFGDVDADDVTEIIIGGRSSTADPPTSDLALRIFQMADSGLIEEHTENWRVDGDSGARGPGVAVADLDADGGVEIVTFSNFSGAGEGRMMDLRVWRWNGSALDLEAEEQWDAGDDTHTTSLAVGNVDEDAPLEIAVVGSLARADYDLWQWDGALSLWQWDGETLELEDHHVWQILPDGVKFRDVSVANIDGGDANEIVVTGSLGQLPFKKVLRVYGWNSGSLEPEYSEEWIAEDMVMGDSVVVHAGDVDGDGGVEMITGGNVFFETTEDHYQRYLEITIWVWRWRPSFWIVRWLDRLEQVFSWEGWPFYASLRDSLPFPWPGVAYGVTLLGLGVLVGYSLWRMRFLLKRR